MRRPLLTRQTIAATLWRSSSQTGEFGRHIELKVLRAEVPLHYLVNSSSDRLREAVNRGDGAARRWCIEQGIPLSGHDGPRSDDPTELRFAEVDTSRSAKQITTWASGKGARVARS
jgi:hypothetical protein